MWEAARPLRSEGTEAIGWPTQTTATDYKDEGCITPLNNGRLKPSCQSRVGRENAA